VARTRASSLPAWPSGWQEHRVSPAQDMADILNEVFPDFPQSIQDGALKYTAMTSFFHIGPTSASFVTIPHSVLHNNTVAIA